MDPSAREPTILNQLFGRYGFETDLGKLVHHFKPGGKLENTTIWKRPETKFNHFFIKPYEFLFIVELDDKQLPIESTLRNLLQGGTCAGWFYQCLKTILADVGLTERDHNVGCTYPHLTERLAIANHREQSFDGTASRSTGMGLPESSVGGLKTMLAAVSLYKQTLLDKAKLREQEEIAAQLAKVKLQ